MSASRRFQGIREVNVMRMLIEFLLLVTLIASSGCANRKQTSHSSADRAATFSGELAESSAEVVAAIPREVAPMRGQIVGRRSGGGGGGGNQNAQGLAQVSLGDAASAQAVTQATDRKIIKNADLSIEVDAPKESQSRIAAIAEGQGGFVVTSEFKQSGAGASKPTEIVTIVVRVPSSQFGAALEAIRGTGNRVILEKVSGQDVTEEYIDLEARIRTQKALEGQFLEIMKQARKVEDALEVQRQLAEVRTEIERLEGRRRFLDNKSSLSTITVTLQMAAPMVTATTTGFGHDVRDAFGDGVDTAIGIVLGVIRIAIILVPIAILIVLPAWLILRRFLRRLTWPRKQEPLAVTPAE